MLVGLFWSAVLLVLCSYVVYPALVIFWARGIGDPSLPDVLAHDQPTVACIVSAFNEEQHIESRISNVLAQHYESAKLRVYVGSDGSGDRTAALLDARRSDRVRCFLFERNRGKASVLNDLVAAAEEDILVFSDANTVFEPDAIQRLVEHFADPSVGVVCGELRLLDAKGTNQDSAYWRLEQMLKQSEGRLGGLLGANGGIYALRRSLYRRISADTITDDFCIAMAVAADGWKLVYAPLAIAHEDTPDDIADEYHRRVRIGIGNYQAFFRHPEYLLRTNWATSIAYFFHKVLRWFTPHFMIVALLASAALAIDRPLYRVLLVLQLLGYAGAALVRRGELERFIPKPVTALVFFMTLNWAFLVAFWRFITGRYSGSWRTTTRGTEALGAGHEGAQR